MKPRQQLTMKETFALADFLRAHSAEFMASNPTRKEIADMASAELKIEFTESNVKSVAHGAGISIPHRNNCPGGWGKHSSSSVLLAREIVYIERQLGIETSDPNVLRLAKKMRMTDGTTTPE